MGPAADSWLLRACRTRAVRQLVTCGLVAGGALLLAVANARYIRNFAGGPYATSEADLAAISDPEQAPRYFVQVAGTRTVDTGVELYEVREEHGRETGRTLKARYYALLAGSRYLIVKSAGEPPNRAEGSLQRIPPELDQHLFRTPKMQANRGRFYPYYLETDSFRTPGYWSIAVGLVALIVIALVSRSAWRKLGEPSSDPLVRRASTWGELAAVSAEIERELAQRWRRQGGTSITDHYLVNEAFYSLQVLRLDDLLWAYKKVIKKSVNLIPVGKDYVAVLNCKGGAVEIKAKDPEVDDILRYAAGRAPWAVFGHTKDVETLFRKDAAAFAAIVADRKRQHEAAA
ncbi:MAG TPA: hypothetical protein VMX54_05000 [Vicinamibacteria bacterium]|nr:hypothetical protein [Vicinamibacteria bacterium]